MEAKLKVRQPLSKVEVVLADTRHQEWLEAHAALIREELNVKQVEFTQQAEKYIDYTVLPNLPRLGPRLGKQLPAVRKLLTEANPAELLKQLNEQGKVTLELNGEAVALDAEDIQVRLQAKEGWAAAQGKTSVVVLNTELNDDLIYEGIARDVVRTIQDRRKTIGCQLSDRIEVGIETDDAGVAAAVEKFRDYIAGETLARQLVLEALSGVEAGDGKAGEARFKAYVRRLAE
jgi:Isoleucyl-tRNA synthetase (EC 6.1.1.5)